MTEQTNEFRLGVMQSFLRLKLLCERVMQPVLQKYGLTQVGLFVLLYVGHMDTCPTIGEMRCILNRDIPLNQGNFSALCKRMEQEGLLNRRRKKEDERAVLLELTPRGREVVKMMEGEFRHLDDLLYQYAEQDREAALAGIQTFITFIEHVADDIHLGEQNPAKG